MWNFEETEQLVKAKFGLKQLEYLKPVLQSLYYRQAYANYHFQEVMRLYSEFSIGGFKPEVQHPWIQ